MTTAKNRSVVLLSGGIDSTVALCDALYRRREVYALGVLYGQRHAQELRAAARIAARLGVPYRVLDLTTLRGVMLGSALTDRGVALPKDAAPGDAEQEATIVPNRNMVLLAIGGAYARSIHADELVFGVQGSSGSLYPDCRLPFLGAVGDALHFGAGVELATPLAPLTKAQVIANGLEMGAPLALTWTCFDRGLRPCGRCGSCRKRREGFAQLGVEDPAEYAPEGGATCGA